MLPLALLALAAVPYATASPQAGSIVEAGNTLVSGMMMFLGNDEKVYIMDKVEGNSVQINNHPAWASVWCAACLSRSVDATERVAAGTSRPRRRRR
jgi:hypothetical protein